MIWVCNHISNIFEITNSFDFPDLLRVKIGLQWPNDLVYKLKGPGDSSLNFYTGVNAPQIISLHYFCAPGVKWGVKWSKNPQGI